MIPFTWQLQGTFLSIFNEDTELGKKYVFDIQKTCREVHDHARRYLHKNGIMPAGPAAATAAAAAAATNGDDDEDQSEDSMDPALERRIQAEVTKQLAEVVCCKICMDNTIDAMFTSCGHVVSCLECAQK